MKTNKRMLLLSLCALLGMVMGVAQVDVTKLYLHNSGFDAYYDYDVDAIGNVEQEMLDVNGWSNDYTVDYTIVGTYQIGTKKTFNGADVPAFNMAGTAEGGVLSISTGWGESIRLYQEVALPRGEYALVTAYYNGSSSIEAASLVGWVPKSGNSVISKKNSFPAGQWIADTISFKLLIKREGKIQLGLKAVAGGSVNSAKLSLDYVKLFSYSWDGSLLGESIKSATKLYGNGEGYGADNLMEALEEAMVVMNDSTATPDEQVDATAALNEAINTYKSFQDVFKVLKKTIDAATLLLGDGLGNNADELRKAIDEARSVSLSPDVTPAEMEEATQMLEDAMYRYNIANPKGDAPQVTTHEYIARGSTVALGRSVVNGKDILEQGFCWSTSPNPTIEDSRTTKYYSQNGRIYVMEDLEPSTIYYVRAYAMTRTYAVGYGDVIKVITLPKGNVGWGYDNGADATTNARISAAVADAVNYLNTYTSIDGLYANVHYGSQTPTADCSYGGWMRVGPNASYQRTGTILHELGHAVGVGTHGVWNDANSPMRSGSGRGDWLGDRATAVVRFLDNSETSVMTGDGTHMWPYGINGAHEDTGSPMLYISNALIYQALGEDGLPPTGGFASPAYTLEQEDTVKYYLKNENAGRGLYDSYIVEDTKGHLVWKSLTAEQALRSDSAAWYITFDPKSCYYQLRNVATGHYVTYATTGTNGIRTTSKAVSGTNENFHIMRSRVDVTLGAGEHKMKVRGYWIIHPEHKQNPYCLVATTDGAVSTAAFSLSNTATVQRWLILPSDEIAKFELAASNSFMNELNHAIERIKALTSVPHTEDIEGTDAAINGIISKLESQREQSLSISEISRLIAEAEQALMDFLSNATPKSAAQPFDLTYMVANAAIDDATGWSASPTLSYSCMEYYQATFDFNQTIKGLPAGTYQVRVQAFQRPGTSTNAYNAYVSGNANVTTHLYANTASEKIRHIASEAQTTKLGGEESAVGTSTTMYMPNNMHAASIYFGKGLYDNTVTTELKTENASLKIGLRCSSSSDYYWTIFDNFRLYYYGSMGKDAVSDIEELETSVLQSPTDVYSVTGVRLRTQAGGLDDLPSGIYIIGNRKVWVGYRK